ncbi:TPA: hypothetical protein N0F65_000244 [Lagenidium giganteum]|uniref:DUF7869 domain-containing protein n=1 Tax=Lagenidium giganteum TaxID=4803 RepID=A0AAV2Z8L7_9STRA|nr:TPA: hypothetical protein N0F65_000244 [Lagenidium giganteum]
MTKCLPKVVIASPRSNVCDVCVIYVNNFKKTPDASAKKRCLGSTVRQQRNLFGINAAHTKTNYGLLYTKRAGRKGSNEVVSMIDCFLFPGRVRVPSNRCLTIYADNCVGQNKNNYVVKYVLDGGAHRDVFPGSPPYFKYGRKENACDRGFALVRKRVSRKDCRTVAHLEEAVNDASENSTCINLEKADAFYDYKLVVNEPYKNVRLISKYQLFRATHSQPGRLECFENPAAPSTSMDLRRQFDGIVVSSERALKLWDDFERLEPPPISAEKVKDICEIVRKYVPSEFRDDPLYAAPTEARLRTRRPRSK